MSEYKNLGDVLVAAARGGTADYPKKELAEMVVQKTARIAELEAQLAQTWQPVAEYESIKQWQPFGADDDEPDYVEIWQDDGILSLRENGAITVEFRLGDDYAFCRRATKVANAAPGAQR